jgi:hypothetical protein
MTDSDWSQLENSMFLKMRFFPVSKFTISKAIEEDDQSLGEEEIGEWLDIGSHPDCQICTLYLFPIRRKSTDKNAS